jgi:hypothetical protein
LDEVDLVSFSSKEVLGTAIDGDAAGGAADEARVLRDTPHILPVPRSGLALLPTVMIRFRRDEWIMADFLSVKTIETTGDKEGHVVCFGCSRIN